jgi:hypothetical protein
MLGIGDGTLQPAIYFNAMNGNVIATDLNGDGFVDLAFIPSTGLVGIQLGRGDGTFTPPRYYPSDIPGANPEQVEPSSTALPIAVADFNGDGIPDIIVPGMILLGVGDGTFRQNPVRYEGTFSALADVNGDGFPDLVNTSQGSLNVQYGGTIVSAKLNGAQIRGTGTHNIDAVFSPSDGIPYAASTSNSIQLQAYQFVAPDFTALASPSSLSIQRGQSGVAVISIIAVGGYSGTVSLACMSLPSDATCTFTPSSLDVGGTPPSQTATLTVTIAAQKSAGLSGTDTRSRIVPILAALLVGFPGFLCAGYGSGNRKRAKKRLLVMSLAFMLGAAIWMSGCGGNSSATPPSLSSSTYSVPVTISTGNTSHTLQLTIVTH